ncbi:HNH endonuclease signature motif containing protein [Janibacter alittae]|uniref:HNH endonuclease signature motif containing protein n=1 Tax=Janibacter alittae TaxID=3115209 RepID=A0ABZ2MLS4_9MICO
MPPQWCDAHHVDGWSRGGRSDVSNGALLCQRHHTRVHTHDLTATITGTGATWHVWRPRPVPGHTGRATLHGRVRPTLWVTRRGAADAPFARPDRDRHPTRR